MSPDGFDLRHYGVRKGLDLRDFIQELADLFVQGDFQSMTEFYHLPLPIYTNGGVRVEQSREDTIIVLASRQAAALQAGMKRIVVELEHITETEEGRMSVLARRNFLDENDIVIKVSRIRYFCRPSRKKRGWIIELMELVELGFPAIPWTGPGSTSRH